MKSTQRNSGISRRVVAYYLFFSMVAVTWLAIGVLTTTQGVLSSRTTSRCLAHLSRLAAAIEMDLLRSDGENIQSLIEAARGEGRLAFCSVVGPDGRYLAHTTRPLVGAPVVEPSGSQIRSGSVGGIRYQDDLNGLVSEYRVPLSAGGDKRGSLRLAVAEPDFVGVFLEVSDLAPLSIVLPLVCVVIGALTIRRMMRSFAAVDERLREVAETPFGQDLPLTRVAEPGAAATGWNRLVDRLNAFDTSQEADSLDQRLVDALRKRRGSQSLEVLQSLRDGVAVTDAEGRVEFANAAVAALLEEQSDLRASPLIEKLCELAEGAGKIAEAAPSAPLVVEVDTKLGDPSRALRVERQPLEGSAGRSVWSIRDITQQKLAAQSRDQFIDAATHELRTPLANIKAYAETLAACQVEDPEQQKEFFNTINTEATRLGRFVDDLLDISSMEVGSLTIRRQNVEVERLLREAASKVAPLVEKKSQKLEVVLPPKLGEMHLDKDKVAALMVNLLGNASKYTPEGGSVRFKAELRQDALAVVVADTGVGIAAEELPHVFDKFFRSEDPKVRGEAGTGLGLSLAREIARLHGGDVVATSVHGEGSEFLVTLPRTEKDAV